MKETIQKISKKIDAKDFSFSRLEKDYILYYPELKNKLVKKPTTSKKPVPITEDIDKIPPAKEKEESKKGLTPEEIEHIEYEQTKLDSETIDEIFAEVENIDEMPIISIDSEDKKE